MVTELLYVSDPIIIHISIFGIQPVGLDNGCRGNVPWVNKLQWKLSECWLKCWEYREIHFERTFPTFPMDTNQNTSILGTFPADHEPIIHLRERSQRSPWIKNHNHPFRGTFPTFAVDEQTIIIHFGERSQRSPWMNKPVMVRSSIWGNVPNVRHGWTNHNKPRGFRLGTRGYFSGLM